MEHLGPFVPDDFNVFRWKMDPLRNLPFLSTTVRPKSYRDNITFRYQFERIDRQVRSREASFGKRKGN